MASQVELNSKIFRGLRAQFSNERTEAILTQAESMFQQSRYRSGLRDGNKPETYELFEGDWIDRALDFLGFGHWAIGRPKTFKSQSTHHSSQPISKPQLVRQQTEREEQTNHSLSLSDLLDSLIPNPLPKSTGPSDNAIHHINIVAFGKPDTGKTTLGESILETVSARYRKENVVGLRSSRDLPALFEHLDSAIRGPPSAVVLFADDMTKALDKLTGQVDVRGGSYGTNDLLDGSLTSFHGTISERMNKKAYWMDRWYDIRGELFRRGMHEGLVVMVGAVHRFYGMPIDMRADADLLLVRSTGTVGTFDSRTVEKMLGHSVYLEMRKDETAALKDRTELEWTGYATKSERGIIRIPRATESQMVTVTSMPMSRGRRQPWWAPFLPVAATIAALLFLLLSLWAGMAYP